MQITPENCVDYIHSLSRFGKKAGLYNITAMLERLGNPHKSLRFIHVAGTNGKGSVSNMTENILISHGYKVGYYTSPYIEHFGERICINNVPISNEDLCRYVNRVREASCDLNPIEFEFITAIAMCYFLDSGCDVVVLEVGLGGRFDATNVIDTPLLNIITPIGLDHTAILGDTLSQIAFEKAGTIKPGSDVVISPEMHPDCIEVIRRKCAEMNATLTIVQNNRSDVSFGEKLTKFTYKGCQYELSLLGEYQISNAILAIEAATRLKEKLELFDSDISNGLRTSAWKCRFEVFDSSPRIILDGAHNSHGIEALMRSTELYFKNTEKVFVFSMLNEKDYEKSIELISKQNAKIIITTVPNLRQTSAEDIFEEVRRRIPEAVFVPDPLEALETAKSAAGVDGAVFVFGSLYLSGYLRQYVNK